jgi:hypothetical protein
MYEDYYFPESDYDYFSSPEFLQAMADAGYAIPGSEQAYAPAEAAYYAPEQAYYAPPAAAYYAPEQAYYAPEQAYMPATEAYYAPEQVYTPPPAAAYYAPPAAAYYAPERAYAPAAEAAYYAPEQAYAPAEAAYYAPEQTYIAPPAAAYYAPPPTASYYAPEQAYVAPPAAAYYAPEQAYMPATEAYYAPEQTYIAPPAAAYYAPERAYMPPAEAAYYAPPAEASYYAPPAEASPVAGIGSPAVAASVSTPSVIQTSAVSTPAAAASTPAAATVSSGTGLQVVNANDYSPSDADLQTMKLTRDQWNEAMASLSKMDTKLLNNLSLDMVGKNPDATNNYRVFTAPLSNKGNATAYNGNSFSVIQDQPVRLVDMATGKTVFQGTGYEAAAKAIELAAGLTKAGGNNADWEIQTGQFKNPGSGDLVFGDTFKTVANEKTNKSILPEVLDILGDAALGFIIGGPVGAAIAAGASAAGVNVSDIAYPIIATALLAPTGFLGVAGAAALGSAVSSAVQGRSLEETLIRAGVTGLTAGLMEGTNIGGKVSDAVGGVLKDIGVESQVGNIVSGIGGSGTIDAVTGEIIVSATSKAAEAALQELAAGTISGVIGSTVGSSIVDAVQQVVPDYQPSPETEALLNTVDQAAVAVTDPTIVVTANLADTVLAGINPVVETAAGIAGGLTGVGDLVDTPELKERIAEEKARVEEANQAEAVEEIVVTAPEAVQPVPEVAGIGGAIPVPTAPPSVVAPELPVEEIVVTAPEVVQPVPEVAGIGGAIPVPTAPPPVVPDALPTDIVVTAPEVVQPVPEVAGIGGAIPDVLPTDIVVNAPKVTTDPKELEPVAVTPVPPIDAGPIITEPLSPLEPDPALTDKDSVLDKVKDAANLINAVLPIVGGVVGGGGGGGGTLPPDTTGITFRPSTLRPTLTGGIGGTGSRYPYTPQTYGRRGGDQETEYLFFTRDPVTGQPAVAPVVPAAAPGRKEGGEIEDDMVKHLVDYHKNGGHQGPGQVKGIGSGQEDKIPAWLSDGEYVWSAQDVADLGDGSTDEGVRRLDKMRQMVRRQAGRKDVKKIAKPQKGIDTMLKAVGGLV